MCYSAPKPKAIVLILSVLSIEFRGNPMAPIQSEAFYLGRILGRHFTNSEAVTQSIVWRINLSLYNLIQEAWCGISSKNSRLKEDREGRVRVGPVVKNPSCNAGDMGSIPALGRSQFPRQLSLCTTTAESTYLSYWSPHPRAHAMQQVSHRNEKPTYHK